MDISLSGAEITLIVALLGAVTGPLALMYRRTLEMQAQLLAEKDRQIVRLEQQNERLLDLSLSGTKAVESATTALKTQRGAR